MVNRFLQFVYYQGISDLVYNGAVVFAFFAQIAFLIWFRKKYSISLQKAILTVCIVYPASHLLNLTLTWIENGFTNWGANNIVRIFAYLPLLCIIVAKLLRLDSKKMCDFLAPSMALQQGISHSVCPFVGCCYGYECSWGIWHPPTHNILFPNQWLECIVSLSIFVLLMVYGKKNAYRVTGKPYPLFLMMFGSTRFLLEFLRDNDKLFWGISNLALHAAFMAIVGAIWYYILIRKEKKAAAPETT